MKFCNTFDPAKVHFVRETSSASIHPSTCSVPATAGSRLFEPQKGDIRKALDPSLTLEMRIFLRVVSPLAIQPVDATLFVERERTINSAAFWTQ